MKGRFFKVAQKTFDIDLINIEEGDQLDFDSIMQIVELSKVKCSIYNTARHGFSIELLNRQDDFILFDELENY